MVRTLPVFCGWTVDARLRQFRRVVSETFTIEFIDFKSDEGDALLCDYLATLPSDSELFNEIAKAIL